MNRRYSLIAAGLTVLGALVGAGVKALADGIPSPNPLYYSGTLTENGTLVDGTRAISINLWPDATTNGAPLCQTVVSKTQVVGGRFRIALDSSCKTAINQNANAYVEVIDGATSLGSAPIGAVPYAVEADHAESATNAADGGTLATAISSLQGETHPASGFHAWLTTATSIPTGLSVTTTVLFDHVEFDSASEYDTGTGAFTPKKAGVYLLICQLEYLASETSYWSAVLQKNGTPYATTDLVLDSTQAMSPAVVSVAQLAAGDSITCGGDQSSGAKVPLDLNPVTGGRNTFSAARLY